MLLGILIIITVLWDAFEAMVLPRRVTRKLRIVRLYYILTWGIWRTIAAKLRPNKFRDIYLSVYGPLSTLVLLTVWALGLIFGFAIVDFAVGGSVTSTGEQVNFLLDLYLSGTTFFTLGLGDVVPRTMAGRVAVVIESGIGFGFLALIIGYLPIFYQAFSRRELAISLLDARGGSPPTATELLRKYLRPENRIALQELMRDWERWSAELLETHLSYPLLVYYRSQHDNQSWLAALTMILDSCALTMVALDKTETLQPRLTFAMARHAVADICQALRAAPMPIVPDRWPAQPDLERMRAAFTSAGLDACAAIACGSGSDRDVRLRELRSLYEPYVNGLSQRLLLPLPPWIPAGDAHYNWRTTAWQRSVEGLAATATVDQGDDHV